MTVRWKYQNLVDFLKRLFAESKQMQTDYTKTKHYFTNSSDFKKICVEAPLSDKSSTHFILTRARGLEILTFDKIRKKAFTRKFIRKDSILRNILSFCQNRNPYKKVMSKKFLRSITNATMEVPKL